MATFTPKSRQQITADMASKLAAETPITDFTAGSTVLTLLEVAAQEDFNQYVQMLEIIRNYSLDTTEGEDLDRRASEFGLRRDAATPHSGFVTISDSRFTKIFSKLYAGLPGPVAGATTIFVDDASTFPTSGSVYIGRGTPNTEGPISYTAAPVDQTSFWEITLDTALANDHGTDETVILSQFGNRSVEAGTEIKIPESDFSEEATFQLNQEAILLDGEDSISNVLVTADDPGAFPVPANSISQFSSPPFTGARVRNNVPFTNGQDEESDQSLRDKIRDTIQSLSRGVKVAIRNGIIGLIDPETNSSVVSANIIPPVILADGPTRVFIDNGRGLEPEINPLGLEVLITEATGGESFFQLLNFPLVKANVISQNVDPFAIVGGETLIYRIGTDEEAFTFVASDFRNPGNARATEISEAINNRANLIEARTITDEQGVKIILFAKARENEDIQILDSSTAQPLLNFTTRRIFTTKVYKNDKLLTKDGTTASLISEAQPYNLDTLLEPTTDGDITVTAETTLVSKTTPGLNPFKQFVRSGDYIKFEDDNDDFYTKVKFVVDDTKFVLETPYPAGGGGIGNLDIWHSPQIEVSANGDLFETEVVSFSPNDFANPIQALAPEVQARMVAEVNSSRTELAVNDTRISVISEIENSSKSKMQIVGGGAALSLGFCTARPLTGSLNFTGGNIVVDGAGTLFLTELQAGQYIRSANGDKGSYTKIVAIENDTRLYLAEGYRGKNENLATAQAIDFSELSEGADKDYTLNLSNGQIELNEPLQAGDSLTAGSVNTRAFLDGFAETYDFDALGTGSNLIVCIDGGFQGSVDLGDNTIPYTSFRSPELKDYPQNFFVGFYLKWTSGNNVGEVSTVASYNNANGSLTTVTDFTNPIVIEDQFVLCQVLTFNHALDFPDPENAKAEEVATAINRQLLGGQAEVITGNRIRIRTSNLTGQGAIEILGGSAADVLGFEQDSNSVTSYYFCLSSE
jgi:uncharacterized phage protein gp47/JayE